MTKKKTEAPKEELLVVTPPAKKAEDETTEIICIIDRSTSIRTNGLVEKTIEGFNSFLAEQKKLPGKAIFTMCQFDGGMGGAYGSVEGKTYEIIHSGVPIKDVPELNSTTFVPRGMTAMYDAIGHTIDTVGKRLESTKAEDRPDKVIVLIMTDGQENSSREYTPAAVKEAMDKYKKEQKWVFIFIGANIDEKAVGGGIGVSSGNIMGYSGIAGVQGFKGVERAFANMSSSVKMYRSVSSDSITETLSDNLIADNGEAKA